jgi:hypothetical protein
MTRHGSLAIRLLAMQGNNQKAVPIIMSERCLFDWTGKLDRLLKATVSDFHLLIAVSLFEKSVAPATANPQAGLVELDLKIVRADARKIHLYYPAISAPVNVGSGVPQTSGRSDPMGDR